MNKTMNERLAMTLFDHDKPKKHVGCLQET